MKRDEKNAQGVTALGASKEIGKSAETESSAGVADCQATPGDWFTANSAMIIPKQCAGFLWNTEEPGLWIPISNKARSLAYIVNGYDVKKPYRGFCRAMFITSTGSDDIPQKAAEEEKDPEVNSVHRWGHLCFDLDDKKDRGHALADLQTLIERLFDLDVKPQQLSIFWSGGKGFHLIVYDTLIGSTDGHKFLSRIYKAMALEIAGDLKTLDTSIYNKGYGKQFRLPNVKRKNGQHKIPLNIEEVLKGTALTIEQFEELAKEPRWLSLPPLSTTSAGAPIRLLYARKKAEIEAMPKQAVSSIVWGDEEREALRENVWPCIAAFIEQHGYYGESNLDGYAYRIIKPFCQETGTPDSEAMTLFGPVIVSMESETYTDDESKLRHVEQEIKRRSDQRWSCADARRFIDPSTFSCDECKRKALLDERSNAEASEVFTDNPYDFSEFDKRASEELKVDTVIQLMQNGPDKELFNDLFRRGKRLESSFQVSDARLCQLIVFYGGDNPTLVDAVFRRSSLMRPYWDTGTPFDTIYRSYAEETINNACLFPKRYDLSKPDEGAFPEERKKVHKILTGAEIMAMQFDNPPLLDGLLDEGESLGILGANGLGKSLAVLDIAIELTDPSVVKLWDRYKKVRPLKVMIFQSEVTAKAQMKRLKLMAKERPQVRDLAKDLMFPSFDMSGRVAGDITDGEFYNQCLEDIKNGKPDIIVLDPLISFHNGDEDNSREMRCALDMVTRLQDQTGTACIITHHLGENSVSKSVFKGRGSSAIGDWLANILLLEKGDGGTKDSPMIKVTPTKCRNFVTPGPFHLQRTPGLHLVAAGSPESADAKGGKQALEALIALGGSVDARARLLEYLGEAGTAKTTANRWIDAALAQGSIRVRSGKGKSMGLESVVKEVVEAF